ncbi:MULTISPECIES: hypothetical protein [unclassified Pseudoalteromonas]|uniref:hypothetical protein n=1 Tax=unclassified Pseudoalteromonas TaxID=194690 RepID=UPI0020978639|nr:hypothetical protein [Pseudoalteromonas sp. XMcav2-N]MCO7189720.1 hypothetical protein [Pseudoalteromonas sp. XMcav2-N]
MQLWTLVRFALCVLLITCTAKAADSLVVIVHRDNPNQQLSDYQLIDLYMGKYTAFPDGTLATVLDYDQGHPLRAKFLTTLTGRPMSQINAYWSQVKFSGKASFPQAYQSIEAILEEVASTPDAIGYVPEAALTEDVKVVYRFVQ